MPSNWMFWKRKPATDRATAVSIFSEPEALAQNMSVDRVHAVVRAAEAGDTRDLFALYRDIAATDAHLQAEFAKRKLAVLGDAMSILPWDDAVPADAAAAAAVDRMVGECRSWKTACIHLLDACLWPVAVVEKLFAPASGNDPAARRFRLAALIPVPHYLLDYTTGTMRIHAVDTATGTILNTTYEPDPDRYIVHRGHMLTTPDNWGGPMRAILFWWLLSNMSREWWARFLDRYGSPFIVGKYRTGDESSRSVLRNALALSNKVAGLVVNESTSIELHQATASTSGDAYERFLAICQREKSKLVLGQTLSAEAQPTGLGSGTANMQEGVRQDIRAWDALSLADTIRHQLFAQYLAVNEIPGAVPSLSWGGESPADMNAVADLLVKFYQAGLRAADPAIANLSDRAGVQLERIPAAAEVGAVSPFSELYPPHRRRPSRPT